MRWFHGTSKENAEKILAEGVLKPGQESIYREDQPRPNAVYVTADYEIAKHYSEERGGEGVVLELELDPKKLIPDEDDVFELLEEKPGNLNPQGQKQQARLRQLWLAYWNEDNPEPQEFDEAWESYNEVAEGWYASMSGELAEHMKGLTDYVVAHDPALAAAIVATHEKGAYPGAVKVKGVAKTAKKPETVKTLGFVIEVPKEHRKTFFTPVKAPLQYWAFKNRPRVFAKEPLIFTFDRKPVAQAVVVKVEAPGRGEGEYKHWHKVYWKPTTFVKFKAATSDDPDFEYDDPAEHYAHGACFIYALALHKLTGLPMVGIYDADEGIIHCAVQKPNGKLLDARGESTLEQMGQKYGLRNPYAEPITEQGIDAVYGVDDFELNDAIEVAERQLGKTAADQWLYHVTLQRNVDDILEQGLKAERGGVFFDDIPQATYLTEKLGIPFWKDEVATQYGEPSVVLKVPRKGLKLVPDEFGTQDAGAPAYRVEQDIPPSRIKIAKAQPGVPWKSDLMRWDKLTAWEDRNTANDKAEYTSEEIEEKYNLAPSSETRKGVNASKTAGQQVELYHGTTWDAADEILKTGLKAHPWKVKGKGGKFVWCTTTYPQAAEYGISAVWDESGSEDPLEDLSNVKYAVVSFKWDLDKTEPDPEHDLAVEQEIYRRIPSNVPASAITRVDYYAEEYGKPVKSIRKTADHFDEEGFWAGEGGGASGVLPVCPQKGTVCLAWRSQHVQTPNCWGTIGGAIQKGKSPSESAKHEMAEETGYHGGITLIPAYVFSSGGGFKYHNYIGVVPSEFSFNPGEEHGWETDHIVWVKYEQAVKDMQENAGDYHPGLLKLFAESKDKIEQALKIKKTAGKYPENEVHKIAQHWFKKNWRSVQSGWLDDMSSFEVGFTIYLDQNGKVQMTKLAQGDVAEVEIPDPPKGCVALGSLHTHSLEGGGDLSPFDAEEGQRIANEQGSPYWMFVVGPDPYDETGEPAPVMSDELFEPEVPKPAKKKRTSAMKTAWQEIVINLPEMRGDLIGGILESDEDLVEWAKHEIDLPPKRERQRISFVNKLKGKKVAVIDQMDAYEKGKGYGTQMMNEFLAKAKAAGCDAVILQAGVLEKQQKGFDLVKWYERLGFRTMGKSGELPLMVKWLKPQGKKAEQMEMFPSSQDAKFRAWFQGSKVVDKEGRPMPVYHGTRSSVDFDEFSVDGPPQIEDSEGETTSSGSGWDPTAFMGAHFAEEASVANQFAQGQGWTKSRYEGESEAPRVIQVFLRVTNPKDFGSEDNLRNFIYQGKLNDDQVLEIMCRVTAGWAPYEGEDNPEAQKDIDEWFQKYENDQSFRTGEHKWLFEQYRPMDFEDDTLRDAAYELAMQANHKLRQSGHDGVRYKNMVEGGHAWIIFDPRQAKSVHAQQFNPRDPRFTASKTAAGFPADFDDWLEKQGGLEVFMEGRWEYYEGAAGQLAEERLGKKGWQLSDDELNEFLNEAAYTDLRESYNSMRSVFAAFKFPLTVWRALVLNPGQKPNQNDFGVYWTYNEESAYPYSAAPSKGETWVFQGTVDENAIAWEETMRLNVDRNIGELESEIRLKPGAKVRLTGMRKQHTDEWQKPPFKQVTAAAHTPEYAQNLISALKQTVTDADFKVIGSVGAGGSSENDLDILVNIHPNAQFAEDEPWISTSGLVKAMELLGFEYLGPSDFDPATSAEKSEVSGKYLDPAGSSIEKFFNPTTMHTVEFWFTESSMPKEADWKSKVLLPTALALGLGAPSSVHPGELSPQQIERQQQESKLRAEQESRLDDLVEAISRAEGAKPELNNPGNLVDFNTGKIRKFKTYEEGEDALRDQINRIADGVHPYIKPQMTLREAGLIYSNGDPNWARNVSLIMRVPQSTKMVELVYGRSSKVGAETNRFYPPTDEWIDRAKEFMKEKWVERHKEMQREGVPSGLQGACKFGSLFAQKLFGGRIVGNPEHQVLKVVYRIIDLTDAYDPNTFHHDKEWFGNPEHAESMASCEPRVQRWVEEFRQKYGTPDQAKTAAAGTVLYLDDTRTPEDPSETVVKTYDEFVKYIEHHRMPDLISFDFDLRMADSSGKTGLDAALYVVENDLPLRGWQVHSVNIAGRAAIRDLLSKYRPDNEVRGHIPFTEHTKNPFIPQEETAKDIRNSVDRIHKTAGFAFRSFKKLWHVGDMNPKSKQPGSLEGSGLSVSIHPEDWKYIAEIGGPTWELTKPGNKFLNFHRLSKPQRKQITAWGVQNGYVQEVATAWRWYYTDEDGEERYMEFETEQQAREEMEGMAEGKVRPAKGSSMKGTDKLKQRTKNPRADDMVVAFDLLVTVYAEDELDCDGVWWDDTYDPMSLSAPRGVIFTGKLKSWKAKKIQTAKVASEAKIVHRGPQGFNVEFHNDEGVRIGHLQIDINGETAIVKAVDVDENYTRQGVATKMYAAARKELLKRGVKTLKGSLEGSGPVQIREKVFGPGRTKYYHGGEEIDTAQAIKIMDVDYGYTRAETRLAAAVKLPTFEQVTDKKTDTNNEFDVGVSGYGDYESGVADMWEERNLQNMQEYYDEAVQKLKGLKFPLTIYRCFAMRFEKDKIDYKRLGVSWSLSSRAAYLTSHDLFQDDEYERHETIEGVVQSPDQVDWLNTVRAWMTLPEEEEIRLKPGAKVKVKGKMRTASAVTFYHGTSAAAAKQIEQAGIKAAPYVWATTDISTAESYANIKGEKAGDEGAIVAFTWDYDDTEPDPEYGEIDAESNRRITSDIPASAIKKIAAFDPSWMKRWVHGDCWLFAIALSHRMPGAEFVGLALNGVVQHVGLRKGGKYYDVRGEMGEDEFNYGADADEPYEIVPMDYEQVMRDGEYGSWIGHEDEFNALPEMREAAKAVRKSFPGAKWASASEPGLLWRAPEDNERHDYQPSWDYEPREEHDPELAELAIGVAQRIYQRTKQPFELWDVDLTHLGAVAMYIDGTCGYPVVLIDLEAHRDYPMGIGKSIDHELKHAIQDAEAREYDEEEAEDDF